MHESTLKTARIVSVIAATLISLASGTNYVYSAWGPQFAERLQLSATQNNLIGMFGNLGMYLSGIPFGILVDSRGPRWGVFCGAILLAAGYYPFKLAYDAGAGSYSVSTLCLFSLFTGAGSCSAFNAALKTSALNYPEHRGTATAFPLSAFGLSAFFFSIISRFAFPDDTSKFLLMLATGTFSLVFVSFFFLQIVPTSSSYTHLPSHESDIAGSQVLHRTRPSETLPRYVSDQTGAHQNSVETSRNNGEGSTTRSIGDSDRKAITDERNREIRDSDTDENSSLLSRSDAGAREENKKSDESQHVHLDIRGLALLRSRQFWQQFAMMCVLAGTGLMTINNIGNDAKALWRHYDDSAPAEFIQGRQLMHVAILSFCSFLGRLLSGIGSDILVKKLHASRIWCLFISAVIFCVAQACAMNIENPHYLSIVSGLTGIGYGFLFGCFASIVAHSFGIRGMSQNWGAMTIAPVLAGNIFNPIYGTIYDKHSTEAPAGHPECLEGLNCYRNAYVVTFFAAIVGMIVSLWSIWTERKDRESGNTGKHIAHEREA